MDVIQLLDKYLTPDKKHFKQIKSKSFAIDINDFYKVVGFYIKMNNNEDLKISKTSGNSGFSQEKWLYIKNGLKLYYLNGDTKLAGLKTFYNNRNNPCITILNRDGIMNLITNDINGKSIKHLYIYKAE